MPKLLILPSIAVGLGAEEFGIFVLALTAIQVVGLSPSNGLQGWVLRDLEEYREDAWDGLSGLASLWSLVIALPFALVALGAPTWAPFAFSGGRVGGVVLALAPYVVTINIYETALARLRVRRDLSQLAAWHGGHWLAIIVALVSLYDGTAVSVAIGFSSGSSFACIILLAGLLGKMRAIPRALHIRALRQALSIWWPMSLSALVGLTAASIDRLLVGVWLSLEDVAVYFAAASLASLASVPFSLLGGWFTTMLGRVGDSIERVLAEWRRGIPATVSMIGASTLALILAGDVVLRTFYPDLASRAESVWWILVLTSGVRAAYMLIRPIIVKLASPRLLPVISVSSLFIKIVLLAVLIPLLGLRGAAYGALGASVVTCVIWWAAMVRTSRVTLSHSAAIAS